MYTYPHYVVVMLLDMNNTTYEHQYNNITKTSAIFANDGVNFKFLVEKLSYSDHVLYILAVL